MLNVCIVNLVTVSLVEEDGEFYVQFTSEKDIILDSAFYPVFVVKPGCKDLIRVDLIVGSGSS